MKDILCNLEEISCLLNSAVDNLFVLYGEMEPGRINATKAYNALYGVIAQFEGVSSALRACSEALEFAENSP